MTVANNHTEAGLARKTDESLPAAAIHATADIEMGASKPGGCRDKVIRIAAFTTPTQIVSPHQFRERPFIHQWSMTAFCAFSFAFSSSRLSATAAGTVGSGSTRTVCAYSVPSTASSTR